ncbi:hypothetical protein EIP91_004936 [Steccherinum ochraceum]|uniref:DUF6535 domain-containing protein n=1 Tax=Steccherinum ochraceum TaxID=92696 RepID=A0A4R0RE15_9APHY|nr:hypothetical protein EIP91_004936 [Steccherinum ochraceum]
MSPSLESLKREDSSETDLERAVRPDAAASREAKTIESAPDVNEPTYGGGTIWTMYNEKARVYDQALVERINGSMDSILVFAGLFSAIVTAFIIESFVLLQADSSDLAVFYLAQISQDILKLSAHELISSAPSPPMFTVSGQSVAVNVLWVLSLVATLACALGATLVQSWTNRYMRVTAESPNAEKRARDRAYYFEGLRKSEMSAFAAGVPAVLHVAVFLFFAGLIVFLIPMNRVVGNVAVAAVSACGGIYLIFSIFDIYVENSPYKTPLSVFLALVLLLGGSAFLVGLAAGAILMGLIMLVLLSVLLSSKVVQANTIEQRLDALNARASLTPQKKSPSPWSLAYWYAQQFNTYKRIVGIQPGDLKQDMEAVRWLLEQTTSVSELEQFIGGIEVFIEHSAHRAEYAKAILELGGNPAGASSAGLGSSIRHFLQSCTSEGSKAVDSPPADQRQSRATASLRSLISIFSHTSPEDRIVVPPTTPVHAPSAFKRILQKATQLLMKDVLPDLLVVEEPEAPRQHPTTRWLEWIDIRLCETITSLRSDKDTTIAFHSTCLSAVLLHRSLFDVAARIESGEVQIFAPSKWSIPTLLAALHSAEEERPELYELTVAISLLHDQGEKPVDYSVVYTLPNGWEVSPSLEHAGKAQRPIRVTIIDTSGDSKSMPLPATTLRNEALLLASTALLNEVPVGAPIPQSDILAKIIATITKGGNAEATSSQTRHDFLGTLERHRKASLSVDAALGSSARARLHRRSAKSVFHLRGAVDGLAGIVQSVMDHEPDASEKARQILGHIKRRRPRAPAPLQPAESVLTRAEMKKKEEIEEVTLPEIGFID